MKILAALAACMMMTSLVANVDYHGDGTYTVSQFGKKKSKKEDSEAPIAPAIKEHKINRPRLN